MKNRYSFIIVDDDPFNNMICEMCIHATLGDIEVTEFEEAEKVLEFLENDFARSPKQTILFLDINMPVLSGWGFMARYEKIDQHIKDNITIYIVSSSVNPIDHERATSNGYIKGFIIKPLKPEDLISITAV